jgi:hypothetical protein
LIKSIKADKQKEQSKVNGGCVFPCVEIQQDYGEEYACYEQKQNHWLGNFWANIKK